MAALKIVENNLCPRQVGVVYTSYSPTTFWGKCKRYLTGLMKKGVATA
jgi:hypothetical protein